MERYRENKKEMRKKKPYLSEKGKQQVKSLRKKGYRHFLIIDGEVEGIGR